MKINRQALYITILAIVGVVLIWVLFIKTGDYSVKTPSTYETHTGRVQLVDTEGMATDGPGYYEINTSSGLIKVQLVSGESSCDRAAITIPDLKVGDQAEVNGKADANGTIQVCNHGTYIKKL